MAIPTTAQLKRALGIKKKMELLETRVSSLNAKLKSILGGSATPVSKGAGPGRPRKRSMSPAAKAKLAASARLRWKKAKAAGKNRL